MNPSSRRNAPQAAPVPTVHSSISKGNLERIL
jgi:hypothetical protein